MQALTNARKYDWATWIVGIIRSFVAGGAGAIVNGLTTMGIDPEKFNVTGGGFSHTLQLMGITFGVMGIVHMAIFLQTHGAPDQVPPPSQL